MIFNTFDTDIITEKDVIKVKYSDIIFISSCLHESELYCLKNGQTYNYHVPLSLAQMGDRLPLFFYRYSRSVIVNLLYISETQSSEQKIVLNGLDISKAVPENSFTKLPRRTKFSAIIEMAELVKKLNPRCRTCLNVLHGSLFCKKLCGHSFIKAMTGLREKYRALNLEKQDAMADASNPHYPRKPVGYLSGTFDLFHIGHLNLLRRAKGYCDTLVVGVNRDAVRKGKPTFIPLEERMAIVEAISCVDRVVVAWEEDSDAWNELHYDYLFVGDDYRNTTRFTRYEEYFKGTSVQIIYFPYTTTTSSTKIRQLIDAETGA